MLPLLLLPFSATIVTAATTWYQPFSNASFLYSINDDGSIPLSAVSTTGWKGGNAEIWDLDLFTTNQSDIANYKAAGKAVVCYFSAGSYEKNRPDSSSFNSSCYCDAGSSCKMDGWDEWWLDIHSSDCQANLKQVMGARIALAKSKGCDAVDPDNVDSYTNSNGHGNTEADQLAYNLWLASTAHDAGLGVGLKNSGDLLTAHTDQVVGAFDFVVVEQCDQYNECATFSPFLNASKPAFDIEYTHAPVCKPGWFTMKFSSLGLSYKNLEKTCPDLSVAQVTGTGRTTSRGTATGSAGAGPVSTSTSKSRTSFTCSGSVQRWSGLAIAALVVMFVG
ncbi:hypothetical protein T439DRAFT_131866 [Meredithblackwellia eburnea MCA 4105]